MCGRFAVTLPNDAMAQLFAASPANHLPHGPEFNVCPTDQVAVAVREGEARRLVPMRWGFIPHWYKTPSGGPLLINARSETIAEKPAFKSACRDRRCLMAVSGFYEWTKDSAGNRLPWYITRADGQPLVFAGIWQEWNAHRIDLDAVWRTCAIVTCAANPAMAQIHHRMPVILEQEDWALWLGEAGKGAARLMNPAPDDALVWHRVDVAVNSNRASGAELIVPL